MFSNSFVVPQKVLTFEAPQRSVKIIFFQLIFSLRPRSGQEELKTTDSFQISLEYQANLDELIYFYSIWKHPQFFSIPVGIYLPKVNKNTRTRCEICSKLTITTPARRQWRLTVVVIVNFEHISHLVLVFLLFTFNM